MRRKTAPGGLASADHTGNPAAAPCVAREAALSRNQSQAIVAGRRSIEACRGRL